MQEWVDFIPPEARLDNPDVQHMEFMLQVYFALYPLLHPSSVHFYFVDEIEMVSARRHEQISGVFGEFTTASLQYHTVFEILCVALYASATKPSFICCIV